MPWQNDNDGNRPNNPWGSGGGGPRRGGGGGEPPQIDEFIKKGQDQLKNILPGGRGGILILALAAITIWMLTGFYVVATNENAVVLRFGKYVDTKLPGLHWHLPYPLESVEMEGVTDKRQTPIGAVGTQFRSSSRRSGSSLMLTQDENIVDVRFTVVWQISNLRNYLFNVTDQEATVAAVSESVMRELVGQNEIVPIITAGRGKLQVESKDAIQATLDKYEAGILILEVQIQESEAPAEVKDAFLDVQRAKADSQRFVNEANKYRNEVVPRAQGAAERVTQLAEAYRAKTVAGAEGEAARFLSVYSEYQQAKDVTRKRIYLETMEEILADMEKIVLDGQAGSGVVPYLPLNQLNKNNEGDK
jgi:membrane protease subunit HflK